MASDPPSSCGSTNNPGVPNALGVAAGGRLDLAPKVPPEHWEHRNATNRDTPLHLAAAEGRVGMIRYIHEVAPGTFRQENCVGDTPAHKAARNDQVGSLETLQELAPETLWGPNSAGVTPFDVARTLASHHRAANFFAHPWTPLMRAAAGRRPADVERLLNAGADPRPQADDEWPHEVAVLHAGSQQLEGTWLPCRITHVVGEGEGAIFRVLCKDGRSKSGVRRCFLRDPLSPSEPVTALSLAVDPAHGVRCAAVEGMLRNALALTPTSYSLQTMDRGMFPPVWRWYVCGMVVWIRSVNENMPNDLLVGIASVLFDLMHRNPEHRLNYPIRLGVQRVCLQLP